MLLVRMVPIATSMMIMKMWMMLLLGLCWLLLLYRLGLLNYHWAVNLWRSAGAGNAVSRWSFTSCNVHRCPRAWQGWRFELMCRRRRRLNRIAIPNSTIPWSHIWNNTSSWRCLTMMGCYGDYTVCRYRWDRSIIHGQHVFIFNSGIRLLIQNLFKSMEFLLNIHHNCLLMAEKVCSYQKINRFTQWTGRCNRFEWLEILPLVDKLSSSTFILSRPIDCPVPIQNVCSIIGSQCWKSQR